MESLGIWMSLLFPTSSATEEEGDLRPGCSLLSLRFLSCEMGGEVWMLGGRGGLCVREELSRFSMSTAVDDETGEKDQKRIPTKTLRTFLCLSLHSSIHPSIHPSIHHLSMSTGKKLGPRKFNRFA